MVFAYSLFLDATMSRMQRLPDCPKASFVRKDRRASIASQICADMVVDSMPLQYVNCEPGSVYSYSNSNYFALGIVVEVVSAQTVA